AGIAAVVAALVVVVSGAWTYYNTNVLNVYRSDIDVERLSAEYEKTFYQFAKIEPPTITDVKLQVDLFPRAVRAVARGSYAIENRTTAPMSELHVRVDPRLRVDSLTVDGATLQ